MLVSDRLHLLLMTTGNQYNYHISAAIAVLATPCNSHAVLVLVAGAGDVPTVCHCLINLHS